MKVPPFYISSRGHSATAWLTTMLSRHPEIVCFHGTRSIPPYDSGTVPDMTPEQFVDALITCAGSSHGKIFGAVHGFYGVACKEAVEGRGGRFAAIIRNPVKRIHSCFLHGHEREIMSPETSDGQQGFTSIYQVIVDKKLNRVLSRRDPAGNLMVSDAEKIFYHYCKSLIYFDIICVKEAGKEVNFRMEDLVSSRDEFMRLFTYITQEKVFCDKTYLDSIDFSNKINTHTRNETDEDIYGAWPPSFKYLFHRALEENGGDFVYATYRDMGYTIPQCSSGEFDIFSL